MNPITVVAFPLHRVSHRRAPLENKVLPFARPEFPYYAEVQLGLMRVWLALAELQLNLMGVRR
jgi:hypothetical protein